MVLPPPVEVGVSIDLVGEVPARPPLFACDGLGHPGGPRGHRVVREMGQDDVNVTRLLRLQDLDVVHGLTVHHVSVALHR